MAGVSERPSAFVLTPDAWATFLASLYERDDRLDVRRPGETYAPDEAVDAWALSAHAEALRSAEVDGDLWGTLDDIEETAATEDEAWSTIAAFYLARGCVLVEVQGLDEPEDWIFSEGLARRLGLGGP
nr:hypothetical protein [Deinococcus betulae]